MPPRRVPAYRQKAPEIWAELRKIEKKHGFDATRYAMTQYIEHQRQRRRLELEARTISDRLGHIKKVIGEDFVKEDPKPTRPHKAAGMETFDD
jgi:hypothetical protein